MPQSFNGNDAVWEPVQMISREARHLATPDVSNVFLLGQFLLLVFFE